MITVRTESAYNSFITQPFEMGIRHLRVAFCDGEQATLVNMAKERIIFRAGDQLWGRPGCLRFEDLEYDRLTSEQRAFHLIVGLAGTLAGAVAAIWLGLYALPIPYIAAQIEIKFHRKGNPAPGDAVSVHYYEGGNYVESPTKRRNPFHPNAAEDPFYAGASWQKA